MNVLRFFVFICQACELQAVNFLTPSVTIPALRASGVLRETPQQRLDHVMSGAESSGAVLFTCDARFAANNGNRIGSDNPQLHPAMPRVQHLDFNAFADKQRLTGRPPQDQHARRASSSGRGWR